MKIARMAMAGAALLGAGTAQAAERSFMVTGFEEIEVAGPYDVTVLVGKSPGVRAVGERTDLDRLRVEVRGRRLGIGAKNERGMGWSGKPIQLIVTAPALNAAMLAGSGEMRIDRVKGQKFTGSLAGSGKLSVASIDATEVRLSSVGSGNIDAAGRCRAATISTAGSGNVNANELRCETLTGNIAGDGNIAAQATKTATLSARGSGDVIVTGGAKCSVSKMGSGQVKCGD